MQFLECISLTLHDSLRNFERYTCYIYLFKNIFRQGILVSNKLFFPSALSNRALGHVGRVFLRRHIDQRRQNTRGSAIYYRRVPKLKAK